MDPSASVKKMRKIIMYIPCEFPQVTLSQLPDSVVDDLISLRISPTPTNILYDPGAVQPLPTPSTTVPSPAPIRSTLAEMLLPPDAAHRLIDLTPSPPSQPLRLDKANIEFGMMIGEVRMIVDFYNKSTLP